MDKSHKSHQFFSNISSNEELMQFYLVMNDYLVLIKFIINLDSI